MKRRVVITGIGPVTGIGVGNEAFFNSLYAHKMNICSIPPAYEEKYAFKSRFFVPVPQISLQEYGVEEAIDSVTERISKLSIAAASLAISDAGYDMEKVGKFFAIEGLDESAVILGVGMSSLQTALHSYMAHLFGNDKGILEAYGVQARYNRMVIPMLMPNAASAWVSILFGIKGQSHTVNASCASGTIAVGEAYRKIKDGYCDTAITGGVECLHEKNGAIMRGFDMLTALTKSVDGSPMPFSKKRSGFLFNEGAGCILILEELEHARRRNARVYAEICGYESNSDAFNIVQMNESGELLAL